MQQPAGNGLCRASRKGRVRDRPRNVTGRGGQSRASGITPGQLCKTAAPLRRIMAQSELPSARQAGFRCAPPLPGLRGGLPHADRRPRRFSAQRQAYDQHSHGLFWHTKSARDPPAPPRGRAICPLSQRGWVRAVRILPARRPSLRFSGSQTCLPQPFPGAYVAAVRAQILAPHVPLDFRISDDVSQGARRVTTECRSGARSVAVSWRAKNHRFRKSGTGQSFPRRTGWRGSFVFLGGRGVIARSGRRHTGISASLSAIIFQSPS